ncbi:MAG: adenosylcobinamide-GDP ribazoletransferase, partial [Anaerolineae bacterium]|nr:adenosylcobinamide-GDP ribazoletransferase [Anaerolineae bacterium]
MAILLALKFLTILPVPVPEELPEKAMGRAVAWYPLVGAVLGLLLAGADLLAGLVFPVGLRSVLVLALWVALTGALHLDGFMDSCDALLAPRSPDERLEILRDVHAGSFAVAGAALLLLIKFAALASLEGPLRTAALIGVPVLGRWAMALAVVGYPYAR